MKVGSAESLAACVVKLSMSDVLETKEKAYIFRPIIHFSPQVIKSSDQIHKVELCQFPQIRHHKFQLVFCLLVKIRIVNQNTIPFSVYKFLKTVKESES